MIRVPSGGRCGRRTSEFEFGERRDEGATLADRSPLADAGPMTVINWATIEQEAALLTGFPAHGRATTSFRFELLWLPVKGLLSPPNWLLPSPKSLRAEANGASMAFADALRHLTVALRELHTLKRELAALPVDCMQTGDEVALNKWRRIDEVSALFLDVILVYLRRLADRFADAARFVLFDNPRSASNNFHGLTKKGADLEKWR